MRFVELKQGGRMVPVNAALVRFIDIGPDGKTSILRFDRDHTVTVDMTPDAVAIALNGGLAEPKI